MATIGLTPYASSCLKNIEDTFGFKDGRDAALFAFAYAVRNNLEIQQEQVVPGVKTKWGTSTFQDIDYKKIIEICYPQYQMSSEDEALKLFESLIHVGILAISQKMMNIDNNIIHLSDLTSD